MYAAFQGKVEIAEKLLDKKADIKAVDSIGRSAMVHAIIMGNIDIIELLRSRGYSLTNKSSNNITPLMWAIIYDNLKSVKYLIQDNIKVLNEKDVNGWNAFMFACAKGYLDIVQYILKLSPNIINKKSNNKETALIIAADNGKANIVQYLLDNGALNQIEDKTVNGFSALYLASEYGHIEVCDILLNYYDEKGREKVYKVAKEKGDKEILKLIQKKSK